MSATFVIDVETGASSANLAKLTAEFRAGKISSDQYAAAVEVAAASVSKFEAANKLAKMSFAQIGNDIVKSIGLLSSYKAATDQASQSLLRFNAFGKSIQSAFADRAAVDLYNAELKKSIQLKGQLVAMGSTAYAAITKENAALQVQNAIRKQAFEAQNILAKGSAIQASSLSAYDKTQMMLAMGAASAFRASSSAAAKNAAEIDKVTGSTRSGSQAFTAYGSAIRGVAGSMGALWMSYGQVLPLMAAFASAQTIKKAVTLSSEFEYTAEYVATLGRYSGQSVKSVSELRQELTNVGEVRHSINDLALGIKEFSKAGVSTVDSLRDIGEMSRFASLSGMELADATALVIGQANAFGVTYADAANMIASAAMSSATDIGEMATSMSYTTELGSVAKVEFSEVAAAMGVLANNGIRGSKAGTALRTSVMRMQNPTEKVTEMLKRMNVQWSAFTEEGKVKSIQAMFSELSRAMKEAGLTEAEMSELQYELFGLRSLKGGANILKDITGAFVEMHESVTRSTDGVTFLSQATGDLVDTNVVKLDKLKKAYSDFLTEFLEGNEFVGRMYDSMRGLVDGSAWERPPSQDKPLMDVLFNRQYNPGFKPPEGFRSPASVNMVDPFANMPAFRPYTGINPGTELSVREGLYKPTEKAIEEAIEIGERYREAAESLGAAREALEDRLFSASNKGDGSALGDYNAAIAANQREMEKLVASYRKMAGDQSVSGFDELVAGAERYRTALDAAAKAEFDMAKQKAIAGLSKDIAEFSSSSAKPLSDYEQGVVKVDAAVASLRASARMEAIRLFGDDSVESLAKINELLEGQLSNIDSIADSIKKADLDRRVSSWEKRISSLSSEYSVLSKEQRAVKDVTDKFADAQEELNEEFAAGSPEARRFGAELAQIQAHALATDKAILRASDSIKNGFVAALRDAAEEMMTFGELGSSIGESLIGGFKQSISDMIVELDFDKDALGDLWEGVWQSVSRTGADFVADRLVGTAASFLGDMLGVDLSGLTGGPNGSSGSPFHVVVQNWEGAGVSGAFGGENDAWWSQGSEAKTGIMGWISQYLGPQVADAIKMVGGAVGVAGGAYGMYSGAKDMSDGNFGTGALKMGTGAVSAYKGAVTLGIIEEGTATKIGQAVGEKVATWAAEKGISSAAAQGATTSSAALAGQGAAYSATSSVNAGTQLALAEGTYGSSSAGGAAAGGFSASGAAVGGIYAVAAMIALRMAMGNPQSMAQKQRDQLNATGTTPGALSMGGVTDQLSIFSETLNRDMVPALDKAAVGSYNAGSQMLVLGRATQEWVSTGVEGQGQLVDAMVYDTWRWDNLKNAWVTVNSPIDGLVDKLHRMKPATDEAAAAAARMIATQAGYPDLADEVLSAYQDQVAGIQQLGEESKLFTGLLGSNRMALSNASAAAAEMSGTLDGVASSGIAVGDRMSGLQGNLFGVAGAAGQVVAGINAHRAATDSLASASVGAASRISAAAGDIGGAVNRIGGLLGRAASFSDPHYHGNADGAVYSYHSRGGIMDQPTVFHVGGEAGSEAIIPLHRGPQTLEFIDRKIDALLKNSGTSDELRAVLVAVATYTKKSADILKRFEYIGIPISKREAVA
jgi:TP901 family phage tail tape measure protein